MSLAPRGVNRHARIDRVYRSSAIVSTSEIQSNDTGSTAYTSSGVQSMSTYSPGRVAGSRRYGVSGRFAMLRRAFAAPNVPRPFVSSRKKPMKRA